MEDFGISPFGVSPYGPGTDPVATEPPADPPIGAKFLNHRTKDFERQADGSYARMPRVRQRVMLALGTEARSSSVLPKMGTEFPAKIDESYEIKVRTEVARALNQMIQAQEITLDSVTFEQTETGRTEITVAFTASDGTEDSVKLP